MAEASDRAGFNLVPWMVPVGAGRACSDDLCADVYWMAPWLENKP